MSNLFDYTGTGDHKISSLRIGSPSNTLLLRCGELMKKAADSFHKPENYCHTLQYGPKGGALAYRQELAKFLTEAYGDTVDLRDLSVNAGASQGLVFIGSLLFQPGDTVFVEEPSYFIGIRVIRDDLRMNVVGIPTDKEGIVVEQLDKWLTKNSDKLRLPTARKPFAAMLYCVPTFNNPTGSFLGAERSRNLIKVLRKYNILAVCDDVYNLLSYMDDKPPFTSSPPQRLFAYDSKSDPDYKGHVISNGSFSKMLGPGLRLGWIEAPPNVRSLLLKSGYASSGGSLNHYTSLIITEALQMGLVKEQLLFARQVFHFKMNVLCDALDEHVPQPFSYQRPKGGFFVWVTFPHVDCDKLLAVCTEKYRVEFNNGSCFSSSGKFKNCMRLSFSLLEPDEIVYCVKQIATALKETVDYALDE